MNLLDYILTTTLSFFKAIGIIFNEGDVKWFVAGICRAGNWQVTTHGADKIIIRDSKRL